MRSIGETKLGSFALSNGVGTDALNHCEQRVHLTVSEEALRPACGDVGDRWLVEQLWLHDPVRGQMFNDERDEVVLMCAQHSTVDERRERIRRGITVKPHKRTDEHPEAFALTSAIDIRGGPDRRGSEDSLELLNVDGGERLVAA